MAQPEGERRLPVTDIHIDLVERSVTLRARDRLLGKVVFERSGDIFFEPPAPLPVPERAADTKEKPGTVVLTGKLKSEPRPGKPDRRGNPTAWAAFAAHDEAADETHVYIASFHRHVTSIALAALNAGDQITAEGYPHIYNDPNRKDTFSVINLLNYPGKPRRVNS